MFPTRYGPANDQYFNVLAASKGQLMLLKNDFVHYRIHKGQERNKKYLYLVNLYIYLNDAVRLLDLGLNPVEKKYILNKNKRRFLTNMMEYFFITGNLKKLRQALNDVNYTFSDFFKAIFQ